HMLVRVDRRFVGKSNLVHPHELLGAVLADEPDQRAPFGALELRDLAALGVGSHGSQGRSAQCYSARLRSRQLSPTIDVPLRANRPHYEPAPEEVQLLAGPRASRAGADRATMYLYAPLSH